MDRHSIEAAEERLAPYACRAARTRGRRHRAAGQDRHRTDFQRDRDRILYSTAFRRLKYKTQVYVVHEGDYYRTRLTHSLEVMQHARTLARALGCNEDLVEAISYAHDLGHPPFGHVAERALDRLTAEWGGFNHNRHSLRVVDQLESIYPDHPGLDLCYETREGLARHRTSYDLADPGPEFGTLPQPSAEAQIVNLADELAYVTHDLDDALASGLLDARRLRGTGADLVADVVAELPGADLDHGPTRRLVVRHLIERLSLDAIEHSTHLLRQLGPGCPDAVRASPTGVIALSPGLREPFDRLKRLLLEEVYYHPWVLMMGLKGARMVEALFGEFMQEPRLLPLEVRDAAGAAAGGARSQLVVDYLASLTDRRAVDLYRGMFDPGERVLRGI